MTSVVFEEIPDKITLAVNISNCQNNCVGCHSSFLKQNIGNELTNEVIDELIKIHKGINCFLFMGEGNDTNTLLKLNSYIKSTYNIATAIYIGRDSVDSEYYDLFDYIKIGSYQEKYGGLDKPTTNQRLYFHKTDITYKFWKERN